MTEKRQMSHPSSKGKKKTWVASSLNICPQENEKTNLPGGHFQAHEVREFDWEQPAQIYQGYIMPDEPDGFL